MKIMSFNIRCVDDPNGHSLEERAPRLKKILDKYNPDVVGFQEVTPKWYELLKADYEEKYVIFNKLRSLINYPEASTIMWNSQKFDCVDKGYFWFSDTPWVESLGNDEMWHCERICQWVLLEDKQTQKRFYYFNLHFGFGDDYQVESVQLIKKTVDALKAENVIITGDFNMTPVTSGYMEMTKYFKDVNKLTANYSGTTYHAYGAVENEHIDYCFIGGKDLVPVDYKVIDDTVDGKYPSDHYGLLFKIDNEKSAY